MPNIRLPCKGSCRRRGLRGDKDTRRLGRAFHPSGFAGAHPPPLKGEADRAGDRRFFNKQKPPLARGLFVCRIEGQPPAGGVVSDGTGVDVLGAGGAETCAPHTVHLPVAGSTLCAAVVPHTLH